jgi:hypothetical protein
MSDSEEGICHLGSRSEYRKATQLRFLRRSRESELAISSARSVNLVLSVLLFDKFRILCGEDRDDRDQAMTAVAELKQQHAVTDDDLLVCIANYGSGPEQVPQLVSITQQF